jgi:lipooligosaccharide transport system permease protein
VVGHPRFSPSADLVTGLSTAIFRRPPWRVVERNAIVSRRGWYVYLTGGAEPFLYLFSVGVGVGALVDTVVGPGGAAVSYRSFVAPGMMAAAAMNAVILDTTVTFFVRFKYMQTYDAMLATPLSPRDVVRGELMWSLSRVVVYSSAFLVTMLAMGLLDSLWAVLMLPGAVLIGFCFGALGLAGSTWIRSWLDFDLILVAAIPIFLFSATFFPLERYPEWLQWVARVSPLYHGADLLRRMALGSFGWAQIGSVAYLVMLGLAGLRVAERRVARLVQP